MVLKGWHWQKWSWKESSLVPFGLGKGLASFVDVLDVGGSVSSMLKWGKFMYCKHWLTLDKCRWLLVSLLTVHLFLRGLWELWEGLLLPLTPYTLEGKYFLQTALDLTSCHDLVVSRVMYLMLHGLLIAQMVMSVTRQVIQVGLCVVKLETHAIEGYSHREGLCLLGKVGYHQSSHWEPNSCLSVLIHGTLW